MEPVENPIRDFTTTYPKEATQRAYVAALCRFLECVNSIPKPKPPAMVDYPKYEALASTYLDEVRNGRNPRNDLLKFTGSLSSAAPVTRRKYPNDVMYWLQFHDIEIPPAHKDAIKRRGPKKVIPATQDEEHITREIIKKLIEFSPIQMRVLIMLLATSGMRIGEALTVQLSDVKMNESPVRIYIRQENAKTGMPRNVFVSDETKAVLEEWMQYRDTYITKKRGNASVRVDDGTLLPFSQRAAIQMWEVSLSKAGILKADETTRRKTIHPHGLRKYFRRELPKGSQSAKGIELTEQLMGHGGYLGGVYHTVSLDELREFYQDAQKVLAIYQTDDPEVRGKVAALADENESLKKRLLELEERSKTTTLLLQSLLKAQDPDVILKAINTPQSR